MNGFRDIHAHFVYGVDDGAQTREDMFAMLDAFHREGFAKLFSTPHVTPGVQPFKRERYERHLIEAREYVREMNYGMTIQPGAELLYSSAIVRYAEERELPTLGDSDCVLMEFIPSVSLKDLKGAVELMDRCGYLPVLAHIERYDCLYHGNAFRVKEKYDVQFQINSGTVTHSRGFFKDREIRHWLRDQLIDYLGTDAHNVSSRPPRMREAYEILREEYGALYAAHLTGLKSSRQGKQD